MNSDLQTMGWVAAALVTAMVVALIATPVVKNLAFKVGAVDVPKDNRRMHDHPIPRMGGLAIFFGFILSVLLYVQMTPQFRGMLLGGVIIVVLGIFDDIYALGAKFKLAIQIVAALVAVLSGNVIQILSNPNVLSPNPWWDLGWLSYPATVLWIVAITNAVNLIDGLDGLACGVSTISALTMLVISLAVADAPVAIVMAALAGGCIGFLPYNLNPAKIFMGDTGSTFLGFMLGTVSVIGLFKLYAMISFIVPFIILGFPIFDTVSAFTRRILKGQNPMKADRSHTHHKLIDMGMNQKQAVATLYMVAGVLGLCAVMIVSSGYVKVILSVAALIATACTAARIARYPHNHHPAEGAKPNAGGGEKTDGTPPEAPGEGKE